MQKTDQNPGDSSPLMFLFPLWPCGTSWHRSPRETAKKVLDVVGAASDLLVKGLFSCNDEGGPWQISWHFVGVSTAGLDAPKCLVPISLCG